MHYILYPILSLVMLHTLGLFFKTARFYARLTTFYMSIACGATYGFLASIFLTLIGRSSLSQWACARFYLALVTMLTGVSFKVDKEERLRRRPAIIISNHQTEFDIALLGKLMPQHCSITAKTSLKHIPLLGWFMAVSGTLFIDRANRKTAIKAFDGVAEEVREKKHSVWIFPEGTRSYTDTPTLLPFKKGAFHLAIQSGVPIIPVVISNYAHVFNHHWKVFQPGEIKIKVLEQIETTGLEAEDVEKVAKDTYDEMARVLGEISPQTELVKETVPNKKVEKAL